MIGQINLQKMLIDLVKRKKFPRFSLLIGGVGSGRRTLIRETLKDLGNYCECGIDVDTVRSIIEQAYIQVEPMVYVFPNADSMSVAAKNALLKVTEEPPNNAYFIMTLMSIENTLNTIRSRATVFSMDAYDNSQLSYYFLERTDHKGENFKAVEQYCEHTGDVNLLCTYDIDGFQKFVKTVVENIAKVSGANSFKIGDKLNLGNDDEKYDLALFLKAFKAECFNNIKSEPMKCIKAMELTNKRLADLRVAGINKLMVFDTWLLDIRGAWM